LAFTSNPINLNPLTHQIAYDIPIWIASVTIPSNQCGWMSSRTASIGEQSNHWAITEMNIIITKAKKPVFSRLQ
jgi:hypothetical protein